MSALLYKSNIDLSRKEADRTALGARGAPSLPEAERKSSTRRMHDVRGVMSATVSSIPCA